jgi:hypothetical protein
MKALAIFVLFFAASCHKPDMTPELSDRIYQDLLTELSLAEKALAEVSTQLAATKKQLASASPPQAALLKRLRQTVYRQENQISQLQQQKKYWTIRTESRKKLVRTKYLESYYSASAGAYNNDAEYAEYVTQSNLRRAKLTWDTRQRLSEHQKHQKSPASVAPAK